MLLPLRPFEEPGTYCTSFIRSSVVIHQQWQGSHAPTTFCPRFVGPPQLQEASAMNLDRGRFSEGTEIQKTFNDPETNQPRQYQGKVVAYEYIVERNGFNYLVRYEDGDQEHLFESEVADLVVTTPPSEIDIDDNEQNNHTDKISKGKVPKARPVADKLGKSSLNIRL